MYGWIANPSRRGPSGRFIAGKKRSARKANTLGALFSADRNLALKVIRGQISLEAALARVSGGAAPRKPSKKRPAPKKRRARTSAAPKKRSAPKKRRSRKSR